MLVPWPGPPNWLMVGVGTACGLLDIAHSHGHSAPMARQRRSCFMQVLVALVSFLQLWQCLLIRWQSLIVWDGSLVGCRWVLAVVHIYFVSYSLMDHQWIHSWKSIDIHWWKSIDIHWWSINEYGSLSLGLSIGSHGARAAWHVQAWHASY